MEYKKPNQYKKPNEILASEILFKAIIPIGLFVSGLFAISKMASSLLEYGEHAINLNRYGTLDAPQQPVYTKSIEKNCELDETRTKSIEFFNTDIEDLIHKIEEKDVGK